MHASRAEKLGVIEANYASAIIGVLSPVSSHCLCSDPAPAWVARSRSFAKERPRDERRDYQGRVRRGPSRRVKSGAGRLCLRTLRTSATPRPSQRLSKLKGSVKAGGGELLAIWGKSQRRNANRVSRQLFLQLGGLRGPQVDFMAHEVHQSEGDGNRDAASFSAWAAGPPDELCGPTPARSPSASRTPPHRKVGLSRRSLAAAQFLAQRESSIDPIHLAFHRPSRTIASTDIATDPSPRPAPTPVRPRRCLLAAASGPRFAPVPWHARPAA